MLDCYKSIEDFAKMLEAHLQDDGFCHLCGQLFLLPEITRAIDVYADRDSNGIFEFPPEVLAGFLDEPHVQEHIGAKLVLCLTLDESALGAFLLAETDNRVVQMCRRRLQNLQYGLPWDSELEIATR